VIGVDMVVNTRPASVLVVESSAPWRREIANRLLAAEFLVMCAASVSEAVHFLRSELDPLVVVLGGEASPDADDYAREQALEPVLRSVPVVAISREPGGVPVARSRDYWLVVTVDELEAAVARLVELRRGPPPR
jgi:hypothetical protein